MKLPIKVSSATSNFMIGVTAAASAGVYLARGYINPYLAAPVALGVLLGSVLGTRLLMVLDYDIFAEHVCLNSTSYHRFPNPKPN